MANFVCMCFFRIPFFANIPYGAMQHAYGMRFSIRSIHNGYAEMHRRWHKEKMQHVIDAQHTRATASVRIESRKLSKIMYELESIWTVFLDTVNYEPYKCEKQKQMQQCCNASQLGDNKSAVAGVRVRMRHNGISEKIEEKTTFRLFCWTERASS